MKCGTSGDGESRPKLLPNRFVVTNKATAHSRHSCLVGRLRANHVVLIESSYTSRRTTQGRTFAIVCTKIELNLLIHAA